MSSLQCPFKWNTITKHCSHKNLSPKNFFVATKSNYGTTANYTVKGAANVFLRKPNHALTVCNEGSILQVPDKVRFQCAIDLGWPVKCSIKICQFS